jgi:asparagine synthase (glutamine-hydrolysing)
LINRAVWGDDAWPLANEDEEGPAIDGPARFRSHVLTNRALAAARADGATAMMLGQHGDALVGGDTVDYVGRARANGVRTAWADLTRHAARVGRSRAALLRQHVLPSIGAILWPPTAAPFVRARLRETVDDSYSEFPRWVRREALARFHLHELARRARPRSPLEGEARRRRHTLILNPMLERDTEAIEFRFARAGLRYVDPWGDRRLAELMLRVPPFHVNPGGEPKWLLREAVRGLIPEDARVAARKRSPQAFYVRGLLEWARPTVLSLIDGSHAAALGYVDAQVLRDAYLSLPGRLERTTGREWGFLWRYLELESWLRRIGR